MTPHFTIAEFCASDTATRKSINNDLPIVLVANAKQTLEMLERIRAYLSEHAAKPCPITITSGYRSQALNAAIGSKATSDHTLARAADIRSPAFGTPEEIAKKLSGVMDHLGIGQLILEYPGPGAWVHVSTHKPAKLINRILTASASGLTVGLTA